MLPAAPGEGCRQAGSTQAGAREEIKEINRISFVLSKRSLESHDETWHMLFSKQEGAGLVITGWCQGSMGARGWHRDVGARGGSGMGAEG